MIVGQARGDPACQQNPAYEPLASTPRGSKGRAGCFLFRTPSPTQNPYWVAKTNGTFTVVEPLEGGNDQVETRD